jgi:hypothetical protein
MSRKSPFQSKNLNDTHDLMTFMTPAKKRGKNLVVWKIFTNFATE